jgi:hypothetical protein
MIGFRKFLIKPFKFPKYKSYLIPYFTQRKFSKIQETYEELERVKKNISNLYENFVKDDPKIEEQSIKNEFQEKIGIIENLKTCVKKEDFYELFKKEIDFFKKDIELSLYLLEYFTIYKINNCILPESYINDTVYLQIIQLVEKEIFSLQPLYLLSVIDSFEKLEYFDFKIWNHFDYLVTRTRFLKNIDILYYPVILKGFEHFFKIESSVSAEEVYEVLEYELIFKLRKFEDRALIGNTLLTNKKINEIIKIYILFSKNLEGSRQLYSLLIDYFFLFERFYLYLYEEENFSLLISLYFSTFEISEKLYKDDTITRFLGILEKTLIKVFKDNFKNINQALDKDSTMRDLLLFVLNKRRVKNHILEEIESKLLKRSK